MKKLLVTLSLVYLSILVVNAQHELSQKENDIIDDFLKENILIEKSKIQSDTLSLVFPGSIYQIKVFNYSNGKSQRDFCTEYKILVRDGVKLELENVNTDTKAENLKTALNKDFKLKTENDAIIFEKALNMLYPYNRWDEDKIEHFKKDLTWYFVRKKFFESKSAFVVKTDFENNITAIEYKMKATE